MTARRSGRIFAPGLEGGAPCEIEVGGTALVARAGDRRFTIEYSIARFERGGHGGAMLVIEKLVPDGRITLYVPRQEIEAALVALGSPMLDQALAQTRKHGRRSSLRGLAAWLLATLILAGAIGGAYVGSEAIIVWGVARAPRSWEVSLGRQVLESNFDAGEFVESEELDRALEALVGPLVAVGDLEGYEVEVHVQRTDMVNAFACPGGAIVVTTALIEQCESPDTLAGVLAHELAHVEKRHALTALARELRWAIVAQLVFGDLEGVSRLVLDSAGNLASLANSRDAERESDQRGCEILAAAGQSARGLADFLRQLGGDGGAVETASAFLSTHPSSPERVAAVEVFAAQHQLEGSPLPDTDWQVIKGAAGR